MMHEILVMAGYASLFSLELSQMYLRSKFEDSISFGYVETELNAAGEHFLSSLNRKILVRARYASQFCDCRVNRCLFSRQPGK